MVTLSTHGASNIVTATKTDELTFDDKFTTEDGFQFAAAIIPYNDAGDYQEGTYYNILAQVYKNDPDSGFANELLPMSPCSSEQIEDMLAGRNGWFAVKDTFVSRFK